MNKPLLLIAIPYLVSICFCLSGCESPPSKLLPDEESQAELRTMQSRTFETVDQTKTLRAAMATLQDLGFVVDKADPVLGTISAIKRDRYPLRITVTVRPHAGQMLVRTDAHYNLKTVEEPELYEQFFTAFERTMSVKGHEVR